MNKIFAWKTISEDKISAESKYSFGNIEFSDNFSEWTSKHFDLNIFVDARLHEVNIADYISEDEFLSWIIIWRGDNKITGSSKRVALELSSIQKIKCTIPAGSSISEIEIDLLLVVNKIDYGTSHERPDGSIICQKNIYNKNSLSEGSFFPVKEFFGDGKKLFYFSFNNTLDLKVSVSYSVIVNVDRNHQFLKNLDTNIEARNLLFLMIIQSYFQKALSYEVFNLIEFDKEFMNIDRSLGKSFMGILNSVKNQLKLKTIHDLRDRFYNKPDEVTSALFDIYSNSLKNI
jgi:hypothetical protein